MRWDSLFDDLESQLERELSAEEQDVEAEEERLRLARLALRDRLALLVGHPLAVHLDGGGRFELRPVTIGRDWMSADAVSEPAWSCVVPLAAIVGVSLGSAQVRPSLREVAGAEHPALAERLGLTFVLRDLCRRRRLVQIDVGGGELTGTIDRVGRDHLDLAVHDADTPRRASAVTEVRILALASVRLVRLR